MKLNQQIHAIFIQGCEHGYHGNGCQFPCPSGTYGRRCGGKCDCPNTECHNVHGCPRLTQKTDSGMKNYTQMTEHKSLYLSIFSS